MLTPISIMLVVWAIIGWCCHWSWPAVDRVEVTLFAIVFCLASGVAFGVGLALAAGLGNMLPTTKDSSPSHQAALVSIRSVDGINGSINGGVFAVYGNIGSQGYYFYYESAGDNVSTPRQLKAGQGVYVYEEARADGEVRRYDWHFKSRWWEWFAIEPSGETWHLRIPAGSLEKSFKLK